MNPLSIDLDLLPLVPTNASRNALSKSSSDAFLRHLNSSQFEPAPADHSSSSADSNSDAGRDRTGVDDRNSERESRSASPPAVVRSSDSNSESAADEELESTDQLSDWFESVDASETQQQVILTDGSALKGRIDDDSNPGSGEVARGERDNQRLDSHGAEEISESEPRSKPISPPRAVKAPVAAAVRKPPATGAANVRNEASGDVPVPLSGQATVENPAGKNDVADPTANENLSADEVSHLDPQLVQAQAIRDVAAAPTAVNDNTEFESTGRESGSVKAANARAAARRRSGEQLDDSNQDTGLEPNSIANADTAEILETKSREKSLRVNRSGSDRARQSSALSPVGSQTPPDPHSTPSSAVPVAERIVAPGELSAAGVPTVLVGDNRPNTPPRTRIATEAASVERAAGTNAGTRDQARFVQRVTRAIQASKERDGEVRLRLSPPELGALRLEVRLQGNQMSAFIEAETVAARNLLRDNLPLLRDRLAEQGIQIQNFDVELLDRRPPDAGNGFAQSPQYQPNEGNPDHRQRRQQPQESHQPVSDDSILTSAGKSPKAGSINVII